MNFSQWLIDFFVNPFWLISCWAVVCAVYDLCVRRIPNILTLGAHCVAIVVALISGKSLLGAPMSSAFSAWGLAMLLTLPAYAWRKLGAGDVKLLAAMGLMGSIDVLLMTYVVAGFVMGAVAVGYIVADKFRKSSALNGSFRKPANREKPRVLPFGFGFAVGYVVALPVWYAS